MTKRTLVAISPDTHANLTLLAKLEGRTLTTQVHRLVLDALSSKYPNQTYVAPKPKPKPKPIQEDDDVGAFLDSMTS
jgi:hypothetical protein